MTSREEIKSLERDLENLNVQYDGYLQFFDRMDNGTSKAMPTSNKDVWNTVSEEIAGLMDEINVSRGKVLAKLNQLYAAQKRTYRRTYRAAAPQGLTASPIGHMPLRPHTNHERRASQGVPVLPHLAFDPRLSGYGRR